jgi:hypothetical protein
MANGYRITAIVIVVFIFLAAWYENYTTYFPDNTLQEKQYHALKTIEQDVGGLWATALAIFILLLGYTKENKKK